MFYDSVKQLAARIKQQLQHQYMRANAAGKAVVFADARHKVTALLCKEFATAWHGTPWDFNGVTQVPGKGDIACGYFVTTVLRNIGVLLNRVKLAQCASGQIIANLVSREHKSWLGDLSFDAFISNIKSNGEGVYVIGLDFHVGFLLHDGKELYFFHSDYINRKGVVKEVAARSAALRASKYRLAGNLTADRGFLSRWLSVTSL
jgi:hypothetical protein